MWLWTLVRTRARSESAPAWILARTEQVTTATTRRLEDGTQATVCPNRECLADSGKEQGVLTGRQLRVFGTTRAHWPCDLRVLRSTTTTKATVRDFRRCYLYRHGEPKTPVQSTGDDDDDDQVNRFSGRANGAHPLLELGIVVLAWVLAQKGRL